MPSGQSRACRPIDSTMKVWLGLISPEVADLVDFSVGVAPDIAFPVDSQGIQLLPFAESLVAAARDHFTFLSYSEGGAQGKGDHLEGRLQSLEEGLSKLQATLEAALGSPGPTAAGSKKAKPAAPAKTRKSVETPPGLDPVVAQHALQAGVSQDALAELAQLQVAGKGPAGGKTAAVLEEVSSEDEDLEEDEDPGAGSADPVAKAVTQMSKVLREMHRDRKEKKAKTLDSILDRAESGSGKDSLSYGKSRAAALRSLQALLKTHPALIYMELQRRLQEDWELNGVQPGLQSSTVTARGWLKYRSPIVDQDGLGFSWHLGCAPVQQGGRSSSSCWVGIGSDRPAELRQRQLVTSSGAVFRDGSAGPLFPEPRASGELGEADRSEVVRVDRRS